MNELDPKKIYEWMGNVNASIGNMQREINEIKTNHIEHLSDRINAVESLLFDFKKEAKVDIDEVKNSVSGIKERLAFYIGGSAVAIVIAQYVLEHIIK